MQDVMLDLETLGTRPGCVIRSIGAIFFNPHADEFGATFYVNVDRMSCELAGLHVDANTEAWWARQSAQARAALEVDPQPIVDALWSFNSFWQTHGGERIWSHGANFDQPILEACYHAEGSLQIPWSFWNSRCTRTVYDIAQIDTRKMSVGETKHNALDDARAQARAVQAAMRRIRVGPSVAPTTIAEAMSRGAAAPVFPIMTNRNENRSAFE